MSGTGYSQTEPNLTSHITGGTGSVPPKKGGIIMDFIFMITSLIAGAYLTLVSAFVVGVRLIQVANEKKRE